MKVFLANDILPLTFYLYLHTRYLLLSIWYILLFSDNFYLKLAITCKNLFPFAPVVRLVIFTVLRTEVLGSTLAFNQKILGSNPGISGWKEEILGNVFILRRTHRADTDFPNIEWFPNRLLMGATTPHFHGKTL